jgi:simple sugar transport system ATP-binding protein
MAGVAVQMKHITKRFGSLVANDKVDFDLRHGEIHCLVGENGAGKTTLMNILYGLWEMDDGDVFVEGRKVKFKSPKDAMAQRIGMVSQHFSLIPSLTVTQNIVLGRIPSKNILFFDKDSARNSVLNLAENLGFKIEPDSEVEALSVGEQQKVEILKALYHDARIIILDEPTAVLTPQETNELFLILRRMTKEGGSVIIITHKLNEAMNSDRLTVMRDGRVVLRKDTNETTKGELAEAMFGKRIVHPKGRTAISRGRPVLEIRNVWTSASGSNSLKDISLTVFEGEVLGIAGVAGNGQNLLVSVIMGLTQPIKGTISMQGNDITKESPKLCRSLGIGCIPEERKKSGLLHGMAVAENLILGREDRCPFARGALLDYSAIREFANEIIPFFDIRVAGINSPIQHLSGGNLQKVILAREFASDPTLIIASQPTRGLDAKTVHFIQQKFREEREKGKAVLLISYDLDEILELSDRIGVLYEGRMQMVPIEEAEPNEIGKMMVGIRGKTYANKTEDGFPFPD